MTPGRALLPEFEQDLGRHLAHIPHLLDLAAALDRDPLAEAHVIPLDSCPFHFRRGGPQAAPPPLTSAVPSFKLVRLLLPTSSMVPMPETSINRPRLR